MSDVAVSANLHLGRGAIYVDPYATVGGARVGAERFIGHASKLDIPAPDIEDVREYSSVTAAAPLLARDIIRATHQVSFTGKEWTKDNVALRLMGAAAAFAQTAGGPVTDEVIVGTIQDRFYQVGGATPRRGITVTAVKHNSGSPTYVLNTDYKVDTVGGRIYIIPGGAIGATAQDIKVTYSYSTLALNQVSVGSLSTIETYMRFRTDPKRGPAIEVELWRVSLSPDGDISVFGDTYGELGFKGELLDDSAAHAAPYNLGRVIYL